MNHPLHDADQISERMAALRGDVDRGVESVAASVRRFADWRFYVRQFPPIIPAASLVLGYFAVSWKRHAERAAAPAAVIKSAAAPAVAAVVKKSAATSLATSVLGLLATMATRAAVAYVGRHVQVMLERRQVARSPRSDRTVD